MLYYNSYEKEDRCMDAKTLERIKFSAGIALMITMWVISMSACASQYVAAQVTALDNRCREGFGEKSYNRVIPLVGMAYGLKINESLGLEFDADRGLPRKTQTLTPGPTIPGMIVVPNNYQVISTNISSKSAGAGLSFFKAINAKETLGVFSIAGAHLFQIDAKQRLVFDGTTGIPTLDEIEASTRTFKQRKIIPFIKMGLQQKIDDSKSLSVFLTWRQLSRFKMKPIENLSPTSELRLKDSFGVGLSLGVHF